MKRKFATFMVMLLAFALLISTTAITVSAETTYTPIGGSTTFVKNLVVDEETNIPNLTFTYTIRRANAVAATSSTLEILEAQAAGNVGTAVFSNADTPNAIAGIPGDSEGNTTAGKKYAQKSVTVTFPEDTFDKPGVYRYIISEVNAGLPGVSYDENLVRYLDVFVVANENNVLSVDSYVLRDVATAIGTDGEYVENPGDKSAGYINSLTQYDFEFSKTIAGNQGDKNKRFTFTLSISGANPGVYPITATDVLDNPTFITVNSTGTVSAEYQLTNGSTVKIVGLNEKAKCTVTENAEDYTATHSLDGADAVSGSSSGEITLLADHSVEFINTRNGIIPTGIIMTIAPFALGILIFGGVIVFIIYKRKKRLY